MDLRGSCYSFHWGPWGIKGSQIHLLTVDPEGQDFFFFLQQIFSSRCKEIEDSGCNGDAAFLEVRVQQVVIEFILNHMEQIFSKDPPAPIKQKEEEHFPANKLPVPGNLAQHPTSMF